MVPNHRGHAEVRCDPLSRLLCMMWSMQVFCSVPLRLKQTLHPILPPVLLLCSRRCKDLIAAAFERSVDGGAASPLLDSRLHDFGFRWGGSIAITCDATLGSGREHALWVQV